MTRRSVVVARRLGRRAWPLIAAAITVGAALAVLTVLVFTALWLGQPPP